ncbi:MAG: hypothetical protein K2Y21_00630 [Phycisphaerales bacterium]|nr:hypothetical protein [Phycisphaerales bacterium]
MSLDRCYLTVLRYPPDLTERQRTLALSHGLAVDDYSASMLQKLAPPAVVKTCASDAAAGAMKRLHELGIDAAVISRHEIEQFSARTEAKRLLPAIGAPRPMYAIEPLRPRLATVSSIVMDDVAMIVFGRVEKTKSVADPAPTMGADLSHLDESHLIASGAAVHTSMNSETPVGVPRSRTSADAYLIDLYTRRGECVRIDSDKCSFDVLGDERGLTDRENAAKLLERLRGEATRSVVDVGFEGFKPPGDVLVQRSRTVGGSSIHSSDNRPAFDFYSAWRVIVHVMNVKRKSQSGRPLT